MVENNNKIASKTTFRNNNGFLTIDVKLDEETESKIREVIIGKRKIETLIPAR